MYLNTNLKNLRTCIYAQIYRMSSNYDSGFIIFSKDNIKYKVAKVCIYHADLLIGQEEGKKFSAKPA